MKTKEVSLWKSGKQYVRNILSVNQFLHDQYIGKYAELYLYQEIKDDTGEIINEKFLGFYCYEDHDLRKYSKEDNFSFKKVKFYDKIISITASRNYWIFQTLSGYSFELRNNDILKCR